MELAPHTVYLQMHTLSLSLSFSETQFYLFRDTLPSLFFFLYLPHIFLIGEAWVVIFWSGKIWPTTITRIFCHWIIVRSDDDEIVDSETEFFNKSKLWRFFDWFLNRIWKAADRWDEIVVHLSRVGLFKRKIWIVIIRYFSHLKTINLRPL